MPRYKGPKAEDMSMYIEKSKYPISNDWKQRNLLKVYSYWPRRTGKSIFEREVLGESWTEKPLNKSILRWKIRQRRSKQEPNVVRFKRLMKGRPIDGRESLSGPRRINPAEYVPSDLARHVRACGESKDLQRGRELHSYISSSDFKDSRFLANLLVEMYAGCGCVPEAEKIFGAIQFPDANAFRAMIAVLGKNDRADEARVLFDRMQKRDLATWNSLIVANAEHGQPWQAQSVFEKMSSRGAVAWTAMLRGFLKSRLVNQARKIFDAMPERNIVAWNAILQGYVGEGQSKDVKAIFSFMPDSDLASWLDLISAHWSSMQIESARICFDRMLKRDTASWNAMIDAYGVNGRPDEARRMFDRMPCPDDLSWPAVIRAYAISGHVVEAKIIFDKCPNQVMYTWNAMAAAYAQNCSMLNARKMVKESPHRNAKSWSFLIAGHALMGDLKSAERLFWKIPRANVTSWNTMIHAYARWRLRNPALDLPLQMNLEGTQPDEITFICLLNLCDSAAAAAARRFFHSMVDEHFMQPSADHYCCMVSFLGRSGRLKQAEELIFSMPFLPNAITWGALLSACRYHGEIELGILAAE